MSASYDAIVIGSGIGGLTCGAFLARGGMRVLVLEKHSKIGGYAHSFRRRSFVFESGIHSVPMAPHGVVRRMLRSLRVDDRLETIELPSMCSVTLPQGPFTIPARTDDIRAWLAQRFPRQAANLAQLYADVQLFRDTVEQADFDFERGFVEKNRDFVKRYHNRPASDYLAGVISDPALREVFAALWPYVGMPAGRAATVFYFMMFVAHFLEGSHCVKGGFANLAEALASAIREEGGEVLTRREVVALAVEGKRVRSVTTADGSQYEARLVVSNVSPAVLHAKLLSEAARSKRWGIRLGNLNPSVSCVGVYLGMSPGSEQLLPSCLNFWYGSADHEATYKRVLSGRLDDLGHLFLLRSAEPSPNPAFLLMQYVQQSASRNWKEEKLRCADRMVDLAERVAPGIRQHIELMEVGSPDTYERYTGNTAGALYGFENTSSLYGEARMPVRTHLANLFQTGHWLRPGGGVWNVTVNGYAVAKSILNG